MLPLVLLCVGALDVQVQPVRASTEGLGKDSDVRQLEVRVLDEGGAVVTDAEITVSSNVGTVSALQRASNGALRATLTPPTGRVPRVAILRLSATWRGKTEHAWHPVVIAGVKRLKLQTEPAARLTLNVAGVEHGPFTATRAGIVETSVPVPPGVDEGSFTSRDRAGNVRQVKVPLTPPPFLQVALAAVGATTTSWEDARPVELDVYVVDRQGAPASTPQLRLAADVGEVSAPEPVAPGRYRAQYRAPKNVGVGVARLSAFLRSTSELAHGVELKLRPGRPARIVLEATPSEVIAGQGAVLVRSHLTDAQGNRVTEAPSTLTSNFGTLTATGPGTATLTVPERFAGRDVVTVQATAGTLQGSFSISLRASVPASAQLTLSRRVIEIGGAPAYAVLHVRDRFDNPVSGAQLSITASTGSVSKPRELRPGEYECSFSASIQDVVGPATLEVREAGGPVLAKESLEIRPGVKPWSVVAGFFGGLQSNMSQGTAISLRAEVGLRLGVLPVELLGQVWGTQYRDVRWGIEGATGDVGSSIQGSLRSFSVLGGLRYHLLLTQRVGLSAAAFGGFQRMFSRLELQGSTVNLDAQTSARSLPAVGGGVGITWRVGVGRAAVELNGLYARSPQEEPLHGNLGGLSLNAGYLVELR